MSITFNQFLSRIDEANIAGSRPRPQGRDVLTSAERARVSTKRDRSPIKRTGGGVSYVTITPETQEAPKPPEQQSKSKPKEYIQKWIPGFPPPSKMKVKEPPKIKVTRKGPKKSRKKKQEPEQLELFKNN
jgi:hypothetical protein